MSFMCIFCYQKPEIVCCLYCRNAAIACAMVPQSVVGSIAAQSDIITHVRQEVGVFRFAIFAFFEHLF